MVRTLEEEAMMSEEEVVAYDQLAKKYMKILHTGFVESIINLSPQKGVFLDVGTGTGWIAIGVAKYNPEIEVFGIDLSDTMLKVAKINALTEGVQKRVHFLKGDAKKLPFNDHFFDSVFSHNMMHHLPKPLDMVQEIKRVAKPDAAILIRDLRRQARWIREIHVNLFGLTYSELMKKEYRDSIAASLSEPEWRDLLHEVDIIGARLTSQFVTHLSIERPAINKRKDSIKIPTPLVFRAFKDMYSSE